MANELITIEKVTALPNTRTPNTIYLVKEPSTNLLTVYVTGLTPDVIARTIDSVDVTSQIDTAVSNLSLVTFAEDVQEMMAMTPASNSLIYVYDASADPNAGAGPSAYVYNFVNETFMLLPKGAGSGGAVNWASIVGRPSSSVGDIDLAVSMRHSHANKPVLDQFSEISGEVAYKGSPISRNIDVVSEW